MWVQTQSGLLREEKTFFPPLRIKPSYLSCIDHSLVTILIELYWLLSMHKIEIWYNISLSRFQLQKYQVDLVKILPNSQHQNLN